MKKSIFTLVLFASTFLFANAMEVSTIETDILNNIDPKIEKEESIVYQYTVITTKRVFTGTAFSKEEMKSQITKLTNNVNVIKTTVAKIALDTDKFGERVYAWGASSDYGHASGVSKTLKEAKQMVKLVSRGDVPKTKVVEGFDTK